MLAPLHSPLQGAACLCGSLVADLCGRLPVEADASDAVSDRLKVRVSLDPAPECAGERLPKEAPLQLVEVVSEARGDLEPLTLRVGVVELMLGRGFDPQDMRRLFDGLALATRLACKNTRIRPAPLTVGGNSTRQQQPT